MFRNKDETEEVFDESELYDFETNEDYDDYEALEKYYKKKKIIKWSIILGLITLFLIFLVITIIALCVQDDSMSFTLQNDF